jgi:hypothetical protein
MVRQAHHERKTSSPRTEDKLTTNGRQAHNQRKTSSPRTEDRLTTNGDKAGDKNHHERGGCGEMNNPPVRPELVEGCG